MRRKKRRQNLGRLLRPRHIAFIGGSQAAGAMAACQRAGYAGQIWAVNPRREEINGVRCVANVADLPEPPDASLIALSPTLTIDVVQQLAGIAAGGAVCMAAGFAELGGVGTELQAKLVAVSGELAVLGPNCMGLLNQFEGAAVWGSDNHLERVEGNGAAFITQSGALLFGISNIEQVFPLGYGISTGNQAVIDSADCIHAVLDDNRVRAIGLYLEGLEDGNALGEACQRALEKGIPIVALKGGDTPAGEAVALSHTGAMVVERDLWDAFAKRYGIVEVSTPKALVETLKLLTVCGLPQGNRLSVVTFSGGMNGIISAQAPRHGLQLPQPQPQNATKLRKKMPPIVPIANPLDLNLPWRSKTGMSMENGRSIAEGIVNLAEGVADTVVFFVDVPRPDKNRLDADWLPSVEGMAHVRNTLQIPTVVAGIMPEGLDVGLRKRLLNMGIAPLLGYRNALEAFATAAKLATVHQAKKNQPAPAPLLTAAQPQENSAQLLDEATSKEMLAPYGLQMPNRWVGSAKNAPSAAEKIGFPVVAKIVSTEIAHKAKVGGVKLGLKSADAVAQAVADIGAAIAASGFSADAFLLEQMIDQPIAEYIVGVKRHSALGLALMIGRGGTSVETLRNYATILLPLDALELNAALAAIGVQPDTRGYQALRQAIVTVAAFATEQHKKLVTLDVNPVIVTANGQAVAADALIVLAASNP
ncbi:MAG: acetate--CoA ligase family protein [Chloroflexota bacterium]